MANHPPVRLMDEDALWAVPLGGVEGHKVRVSCGELWRLKVSCGGLKGGGCPSRLTTSTCL